MRSTAAIYLQFGLSGSFLLSKQVKMVLLLLVVVSAVFRIGLASEGEYIICLINPLKTKGLSHPYQLDESIFIFRGSGVIFNFYFIFR